MPNMYYLPPESFKRAIKEALGVGSEEQLRLRWIDEERENIFAEGYVLDLYEVEVEKTSPTGISFRKHIIRDTDDAFSTEVLVPFSERTQLEGQAVAAEIEAKRGELDERGFPTRDVLLWYDS